MNQQIIDMENFDLDESLEELAKKRYAMPPVVVAALRQAGLHATKRLLNMVSDEDAFEALSAKDQLRLIELIMDRAYGRSETASGNDAAVAKLGENTGRTSDHAQQLDQLRERELKARRRTPIPNNDDVLAQLDEQNRAALPARRAGGAAPQSSSPAPYDPRNRGVTQNVVALRRSTEKPDAG